MKTPVLSLMLCFFLFVFQCCVTNTNKNNEENTPPIARTVVEKHGKLSVDGTFMVDEKGEKVVLRGVSFGWHNWWPRFYNQEAVETFANDWQCSVVRAAMGVDPDRGYISDPQFSTECVTKVVDAAIENGIYVKCISAISPK